MADRWLEVSTGRLEAKIAIVTGGAQGIGQGIVEKLCREGAVVAFLDRDGDRGSATAAHLQQQFPQNPPRFVRCDITDAGQTEAAIGSVLSDQGRVDVLVNNAGIAAYYDAAEMTEDQWESVFAVDLKGVWLCAKYVLPAMRAARSGSIVNIASIHARLTLGGMFPYAAAKTGVVGLTRSLALDEGPRGIRVNAVSPGYTRTHLMDEFLGRQPDPEQAEREIFELHPLRRIASTADIANAVAFLASDEAAFITGAEIAVDGGLGAKFHS